MTEITVADPLREVYMIDTPDGKHFCPKFLRGYRNAATNTIPHSPHERRRVVKVDLIDFEDAAKSKKKLVVPIVHALPAGPNAVFVTYLILTPDVVAATSIILLGRYQKLPEMEIEGI